MPRDTELNVDPVLARVLASVGRLRPLAAPVGGVACETWRWCALRVFRSRSGAVKLDTRLVHHRLEREVRTPVISDLVVLTSPGERWSRRQSPVGRSRTSGDPSRWCSRPEPVLELSTT